MLSISLLGPVQIGYNTETDYIFHSRNAEALLIYLAVEHVLGQPVHQRPALMAHFWPDTLPRSAQVNLRQALYKLRQAIPTVIDTSSDEIPFVLSDRQIVRLNPEAVFDLDVAKFMRLAAGADQMEQSQAVDLYRGNFLADFSVPDSNPFELWAQVWRQKLDQAMLNTLAALTEQALAEADYASAENYARRQLEIDDLREQGHFHLILALSQSHRRHEAINHFEAYSHALQAELGLSPSPEIAALAEAIRLGEGEGSVVKDKDPVAPAIKGIVGVDTTPVNHETVLPSEIPNNLPFATGPIIGRQEELSEINHLLAAPKTRLITFTGPGGIGKTRLSLAVAETKLTSGDFTDGVFFVPLAGIDETERIVSVIAESIELRLQQGERQLLAYLRAKKVLLVLDNFEHLIEGSGLITRILQATPGVQFLVTSRQRLNLVGEQIYPIGGLPVEDEGAIGDAIQLFVSAAQRVRPDFDLTPENRGALNGICRLVDGNPLALELAAAWVDLLTPEEIGVEIQRCLDFLETDLRDIPERHRSMRAVFDTSWQNLTSKSQQILGQISVFRGGFTREAAEVVVQASLRDLATLVNKSLLSFDHAEDRYSIHELLRQYSATKLNLADMRDRHRAYYCGWLLEHTNKIIGAEQGQTLALIKKEMDNIRAAVNHAVRTKKLDDLDRVIYMLGLYYGIQNYNQEGVLFISHLMAKLSENPDTPSGVLFWGIATQMNLLGALGREAEAWQMWPRCQALLAQLSLEKTDVRMERAFVNYIEGFHLYIRQPDRSRLLFQQSYELAMEANEQWLAGHALLGIARAARNQGDWIASEATITDGLAIFQSLNDRLGVEESKRLLGFLLGLAGRYSEAERVIKEGMVITRQLNLAWEIANGVYDKLRMVRFYSGRFDEALVNNAEYFTLSEEHGFTWGVVKYKVAQGLLYLHLGHYLQAQELGEAAVLEAQNEAFLCEALILLTQANIALDDIDTAGRHLTRCETLCPSRMMGMGLYVAGNELYRSLLKVIEGQPAIAWDFLRAELSAALGYKNGLTLSNAIAVAAYLKAGQGEGAVALELYALAKQNPFVANSKWFEDVIGRKIQLEAQNLAPETVQAAQLRGKELDLWSKAEELLGKHHAP